MDQILLFVFLGLGAGAAYALLGLGIVVIYKGSGVVNFAQGAIAMFSAFVCSTLVRGGLSAPFALLATCAIAAIAGAGVYLLVMRPLRNAPALSQIVASLGVLLTLNALAVLFWGETMVMGQQAVLLFPASPVTLFGISFGVDRLYLLATAVVLTGFLAWLYGRTGFGVATRAAAESERASSLLGISPDRVAAVNWAIGCGLAGLAGALIAPISGLNASALTWVVLPALAAALVGSFTSFVLTAAAGVLIGVGQSIVTGVWTLQGVSVAFPLVVVVIAIAVAGKRIPLRGTLTPPRPAKATDGRVTRFWLVATPVVIVGSLLGSGEQLIDAITASMIAVIVALSLVVVTGYVGQANLAPLSFAAVGAFGASLLGTNLGLPFPLPIILSALVAILFGALIGLPALRVRGVNLAVITLGMGIAVDAVVFQNYEVSGGVTGRLVPSPSLFGVSFDAATHPTSFALMVFVVLGLLTIAVANLRRSAVGRKMLSVRANERAAAAVGVNVALIKIYAFALSAAIGSIAGGLLAYQAGATSGNNFSGSLSLAAVALAFIGGIGAISGAYQAGFLVTGGVFFVLVNKISGAAEYWDVLTGLLLIATVVTQPDGIALKNQEIKNALLARRARRQANFAG